MKLAGHQWKAVLHHPESVASETTTTRLFVLFCRFALWVRILFALQSYLIWRFIHSVHGIFRITSINCARLLLNSTVVLSVSRGARVFPQCIRDTTRWCWWSFSARKWWREHRECGSCLSGHHLSACRRNVAAEDSHLISCFEAACVCGRVVRQVWNKDHSYS